MNKCTVCADPRRDAIEQLLKAGVAIRAIADGCPPLSKDAVNRHRRHMGTASEPPAGAASQGASLQRVKGPAHSDASATVAAGANCVLDVAQSPPDHNPDEFLAEADRLRKCGWDLLDRAKEVGELRTAVGALREVRGTAEFKARLTGRLNEGTSTTFNIAVVQLGGEQPVVQCIDIEKTR